VVILKFISPAAQIIPLSTDGRIATKEEDNRKLPEENINGVVDEKSSKFSEIERERGKGRIVRCSRTLGH
jgi:hypothetical protein